MEATCKKSNGDLDRAAVKKRELAVEHQQLVEATCSAGGVEGA